MNKHFEAIIEIAERIVSTAKCDMDLFGIDFWADDYRKLTDKIEDELKKIEKIKLS